MKNITIKNIPEEVEEKLIKIFARVVERYYEETELEPSEEKQTAFRDKVNSFREANSLPKKYK